MAIHHQAANYKANREIKHKYIMKTSIEQKLTSSLLITENKPRVHGNQLDNGA
jgi:hypothetical protein